MSFRAINFTSSGNFILPPGATGPVLVSGFGGGTTPIPTFSAFIGVPGETYAVTLGTGSNPSTLSRTSGGDPLLIASGSTGTGSGSIMIGYHLGGGEASQMRFSGSSSPTLRVAYSGPYVAASGQSDVGLQRGDVGLATNGSIGAVNMSQYPAVTQTITLVWWP